jgi:hypothetical protein
MHASFCGATHQSPTCTHSGACSLHFWCARVFLLFSIIYFPSYNNSRNSCNFCDSFCHADEDKKRTAVTMKCFVLPIVAKGEKITCVVFPSFSARLPSRLRHPLTSEAQTQPGLAYTCSSGPTHHHLVLVCLFERASGSCSAGRR